MANQQKGIATEIVAAQELLLQEYVLLSRQREGALTAAAMFIAEGNESLRTVALYRNARSD